MMRAILNNGPQAGRVIDRVAPMADGRPPDRITIPVPRVAIELPYTYDEDMTLVHGWHRHPHETHLRPCLVFTHDPRGKR